jgi:protease-4
MRFLFAATIAFLTIGCAPSFLVTPVQNIQGVEEVRVRGGKFGGGKIALIEVEGLLANVRTGGVLQPQENKLSLFTEQLAKAESDPKVKAIVLRVNSPGGTVTCSDTMYDAIKHFRERTKKPVIACAQEVMASGAYYVATGCNEIYAQPTSVVGSIGVIINTFTVDGTLAKIGVRNEVIKSGPLKDMGSPFKPFSDDERAVMQGMIDEYYGRFVQVVQAKCNIQDPQKLKIATDGRVFSGAQAHALGLVDKIGSLEDAIDRAKELSGTREATIVMYKRPYGYQGSIYASNNVPVPQGQTLNIPLPESSAFLPRGFYYLWEE